MVFCLKINLSIENLKPPLLSNFAATYMRSYSAFYFLVVNFFQPPQSHKFIQGIQDLCTSKQISFSDFTPKAIILKIYHQKT